MNGSNIKDTVKRAMDDAATRAAEPAFIDETDRLEGLLDMIFTTSSMGVAIKLPAPFIQAVTNMADYINLIYDDGESAEVAAEPPSPLGPHTLSSAPAFVLSLPEAVREVLRDNPGSALTTSEVYDELVNQGWVSNSSDPKNVVNNALSKAMAEWPDEIVRPARGAYKWEPKQPELPSTSVDGGDTPPDAGVEYDPNYYDPDETGR